MKALIIIILLAGCNQRQFRFEIDGIPYEYKSNSVASDIDADVIKVVIPGKAKIIIKKFKQDNDSVRVYTPSGIVTTEAEAPVMRAD